MPSLTTSAHRLETGDKEGNAIVTRTSLSKNIHMPLTGATTLKKTVLVCCPQVALHVKKTTYQPEFSCEWLGVDRKHNEHTWAWQGMLTEAHLGMPERDS